MKHRLAAVFTRVDDCPKPIRKVVCPRQFGSDPMKMANQRNIRCGGFCQRDDVAARNDKQMHWRLRVYIRKSNTLVILV